MQAIIKDIDISAPREKVWNVLTDDASYRDWSSAFSPGSHAITTWEEGTEVRFVDESGAGMLGIIARNVPNEILSMTYDGMVGADGTADISSPAAMQMKGATEEYTLVEIPGGTHLHISLAGDFDENMKNMLLEPWDRALLRIKELSETA